MKIAPRTELSQVENDEAVVETLKALTGSEIVRSKVGDHPETGNAIHQPGYRIHAAGFAGEDGRAAPMLTFTNEKGQENQVPAHRVADAMGVPAPESPDKNPRPDRPDTSSILDASGRLASPPTRGRKPAPGGADGGKVE